MIRYLILGFVILVASTAAAAPRPSIEQLIEQLGHPRYAERQSAQAQLLALGERTRPLLTQAQNHTDAEISDRSQRLLAELDRCRPGYRRFIYLSDIQANDTRHVDLTGRVAVTVRGVTHLSSSTTELELHLELPADRETIILHDPCHHQFRLPLGPFAAWPSLEEDTLIDELLLGQVGLRVENGNHSLLHAVTYHDSIGDRDSMRVLDLMIGFATPGGNAPRFLSISGSVKPVSR